MDSALKKDVLKLLDMGLLAVIATVSDAGQPESAVLAFSNDDALNIVVGTYTTSRKYKNIQRDPRVSLTFGLTFEEEGTVQYEGVARELIGDERQRAIKQHTKKNPGSAKYINHPDQTYFLIEPRWIRYTDYRTDPETISEHRFS